MPGIYLKPLTTYRLEQNKDQSLITRSILQNDLIIINNKEQENNLIAIGFFKYLGKFLVIVIISVVTR